MAKLPGYLRLCRTEWDGDEPIFVVKVRLWHPGFWLLAVRTLFNTLTGRDDG